VEHDLAWQNGNPVRVLVAGREHRAPAPFYAGGRTRSAARTPWWDAYADAPLAVFGHYWRRFPLPPATPPALAAYAPAGGRELFRAADAAGPGAPLGPRGTAVCVDFSAGLRYEERGKRLPPGALGTHLVALRLPERALHRDDGAVLPLRPPPPPAPEAACAPAPAPAGDR
jgi:hypothetical protein